MTFLANAATHFGELAAQTNHHIVVVQGPATGVTQLFDQMKATLGASMAQPKLHGDGAEAQLIFGLAAREVGAKDAVQSPQQIVGDVLKGQNLTAEVTGGVIHPTQRPAAENVTAARRNWVVVSL